MLRFSVVNSMDTYLRLKIPPSNTNFYPLIGFTKPNMNLKYILTHYCDKQDVIYLLIAIIVFTLTLFLLKLKIRIEKWDIYKLMMSLFY